ncbi:chaplin [Streptomyces flavalbus]|uniref:Chaplin n=1 Tax=Streptomyces flavalbus TaxID=2665155 RepID=A0ABW2W6L0_9ACTN
MRQTLSRGMVAAAAATGILSLCGSPALADSTADAGARQSPGVASGNAAQAPVHVPVNACGNTVDVVAALNPAFGNSCANVSHTDHGGHGGHGGGHGHDGGYGDGGYGDGGHGGTSGSSADGAAVGSPGVGSGNNAQVPVDVPVNACGNTVDVVGALNPAFGNGCANAEQPGYGDTPPTHPPTPPSDDEDKPPADEEQPPPPADEEEQPPGDHHEPPADEEEQPPAAEEEPGTPPEGEEEHGTAPELAETGGAALLGASAASAALIAAGTLLYRRGRATSPR